MNTVVYFDMGWIEYIFSAAIGTVLFIPIGILIIIFYNKVFWFVGGLYVFLEVVVAEL